MKLMYYPNPREYTTADRQPVCLLKFLLLVNNGSVDYVQFIAPHEIWSYLSTNSKRVKKFFKGLYKLLERIFSCF